MVTVSASGALWFADRTKGLLLPLLGQAISFDRLYNERKSLFHRCEC